MCKSLNLRAVGKTSELLSRVLENCGQQQPSGGETTRPVPSTPAVTSTDDVAAAKDGVVESLVGDTIDELLSAVGAGLESDSSSDSSSAGSAGGSAREEAMARAGVAAAAPPTDFVMEDVRPVFDELSDEQWEKVGRLGQLLTEWNSKINLISRKDIANVMKRHLIPCLAMAKALDFEDGIYVLDVGTGGGLPGLPLAICYPSVKFTLIDGTGKKIAAVADMAERLGLTNVRTFHVRAEEVHEAFDFVMGRAVTNLPKFVGFIDKNLKPNDTGGSDSNSGDVSDVGSNTSTLKRGVLYMRGEVSAEELAELGAQPSTVIPLQRVLEEAGQDGDVALGDGVDDRGYSSVFHFTSEAIWNRVPVTSGLDRRG
eukprot:g2308.t1